MSFFNRGVPFISLTEGIDLSIASGVLQFRVISAFGEFERNIIWERIKGAFTIDKDGIMRSVKGDKPVGKRDGDKNQRRRSGYLLRWSGKKNIPQ